MSDDRDLLEPTETIPNPFIDSEETETEELESTMTESEVYFDEEASELKTREIDETEELENSSEQTDTEIEQLRRIYENYQKAGDSWQGPANRVRGKLVAALEERRSSLDTEIDDLRSYTPDEKADELKSERRELTQEIEELRA